MAPSPASIEAADGGSASSGGARVRGSSGGKKKRTASTARAATVRCGACTRQPILLWIFIVWLATFVVLTFKLDQFRSAWTGDESSMLSARVGGLASTAAPGANRRNGVQLVRDHDGNLRVKSPEAEGEAEIQQPQRGGGKGAAPVSADGDGVGTQAPSPTELTLDQLMVQATEKEKEDEPELALPQQQDDEAMAFVVEATRPPSVAPTVAATAAAAAAKAESQNDLAARAAAAAAGARSAVRSRLGGGGGGEGTAAPAPASNAAAAAPTDPAAANPNRGWRGFLPANKVSSTLLLYPELLPPDGISASSLIADAPPLTLPVLMHFRNKADGRCMDVDVENSRHVIRTMDCVPGRRRQQWDVTYRNEIQSVHYADLCLALTSDAASFYPAPCALSMQTQHWELTPSGLFRSLRRTDLCLGTHPGATLAVSDVVVMPCSAAANSSEHTWNLVPSGEPILTVVGRFGAVKDAELPEALNRVALALDRQQVFNRTDFVFVLPDGVELPPAFTPLASRGWQFRTVPRAPFPAGLHPALASSVQTTVQVSNMTLVMGGRYLALLDHPASLEAAGPYYLANAIWYLLLNPIANVAVHGTPEPIAPNEAYQQGCLCLRSLAIPFSSYQTLTALLASSAMPVMTLKLWREAGGLRPIVGQSMWSDCATLAFWLTADAIVGLQLALVPTVGAITARPDRPHLPVNFPRTFDECPIPPALDDVLPEELDGTAPTVTSVAIVTRSWVILTAPEHFPDDEILQAMCVLLQVEPAAVLGSPHFLLIKQLAPISAHQRFMDGLRVEGTGGHDIALKIYMGLVSNKNFVGAAQAQPWIYRYRAELLETVGEAEMTDEVCTTPLTPSRGDDYDENVATPLIRQIEAAMLDGSMVYHYVWTMREGDMFSALEFLSIESVFKNDPTALVVVHSDVVDSTDLAPWTQRNLRILLVPRNLIRWATDNYWFSFVVDQLEALYGTGPYWYSHSTDLWRLWILDRFGGAYIDTDVILQKMLNRKTLGSNVLGLESGSLQVEKSHEPVFVNTAVMMLERSSAFAQRCMRLLARRYRSTIWGSVGPRLITSAVQRSGVHVQSDSFMNNEIRVLSTTAFYPVHWRKSSLQQFYEKRISEMAWSNMRNKNTAMHFWRKLSGSFTMVQDSLAQRVMRSNCELCSVAAMQGIVTNARTAKALAEQRVATAAPTLAPTTDVPPAAAAAVAAARDARPGRADAADGDGDRTARGQGAALETGQGAALETGQGDDGVTGNPASRVDEVRAVDAAGPAAEAGGAIGDDQNEQQAFQVEPEERQAPRHRAREHARGDRQQHAAARPDGDGAGEVSKVSSVRDLGQGDSPDNEPAMERQIFSQDDVDAKGGLIHAMLDRQLSEGDVDVDIDGA